MPNGLLWLRSPLAAPIALALLVLFPFFFVHLPPLTDLPAHMARYAVQIDGGRSPDLARFYDFHWAYVANLGVDLLVQGLTSFTSLDRAVWASMLLVTLCTVIGLIVLTLVAGERLHAGLPWAAIFIYSAPYSYGFLNYCFGLACALLIFAGWVRLAGRPWLQACIVLAVSPIVIAVHLIGWVLMATFIGGYELGLAIERRGVGFRTLVATARSTLPLTIGLILIGVWRLQTHASGDQPIAWHDNLVREKLLFIVRMLRDQNRTLDVGSVALSALALALALYRGAKLPLRYAMPIALVGLLYGMMPSEMFGGTFADMRLAPVMPMLLFSLLDCEGLPQRDARLLGAIGTALLVLRIAVTTIGWHAADGLWTQQQQALAQVPYGSRILVFNPWPCGSRWTDPRTDHLGNFAVVRRHAWVNVNFQTPGMQLLTSRYDTEPDFTERKVSATLSRLSVGACARTDVPTFANTLPRIPWDKIDYVWLVGFRLDERVATPQMHPIWADQNSAMYVVRPITRP